MLIAKTDKTAKTTNHTFKTLSHLPPRPMTKKTSCPWVAWPAQRGCFYAVAPRGSVA